MKTLNPKNYHPAEYQGLFSLSIKLICSHGKSHDMSLAQDDRRTCLKITGNTKNFSPAKPLFVTAANLTNLLLQAHFHK